MSISYIKVARAEMQVWKTGDSMTGVGTAEHCNTLALLHAGIFSTTGV
jgi:hypothetical protein